MAAAADAGAVASCPQSNPDDEAEAVADVEAAKGAQEAAARALTLRAL